ncbi:MAG: sigma-70 family RNA polymerase sigma factor [Planctomycetaceae bacterium]|nr:sigma-70 family RNA polymerase sigma factor [Planctomycetaceae bacterium]
MAFSDIDRQLLQRCLARQPRAWEDFVDRFLGLVVHVVSHTGHSRSIGMATHDRDDLVAEVFTALLADDFAVLRRFRGQSSLATYLTVIARRVVVREILKRRIVPIQSDTSEIDQVAGPGESVEERLANREEVERLLDELHGEEADVVRLFHLEGKSYDEISRQTGVPTNSVGPTLSRARAKLRRQGLRTAAN